MYTCSECIYFKKENHDYYCSCSSSDYYGEEVEELQDYCVDFEEK